MISNLIERNQSYVQHKGQCSTLILRSFGIPQGDILGPDLFNIYIDPLLDKLGHHALAFADDLVLTNNDPDHLQLHLNACSAWALATAMEFNTSKSVIMSDEEYLLTLAGIPLQQCKEYRYLGVPFTSRGLAYQKHMENNLKLMTLARQKFAKIGYTKHIRDALHPRVKLLIFKAFVRSMFEYGWALAIALGKQRDSNRCHLILQQVEIEYRENVSIICSTNRMNQNPKVYYSITGLANAEERLQQLQYKLCVHLLRSATHNPIWNYISRPLNHFEIFLPLGINRFLFSQCPKLIATCPQSISNYLGSLQVPTTTSPTIVDFAWSCCSPCHGNSKNRKYYNLKSYSLTPQNTLLDPFDPTFITNKSYSYNHSDHLKSELLLKWHPITYTNEEGNPHTRIPPFARGNTLTIRSMNFCDKLAVYKAIMFRAVSNPIENTCICGERYMQSHINKCIIPWMDIHCPKLLHKKLTTAEMILNHNKMELFHLITAIAEQCCRNSNNTNFHPGLTAVLRYVLKLNLFDTHTYLTQTQTNVDRLGIVDTDNTLTNHVVRTIFTNITEFQTSLACLFIPTTKLNLLDSLPNRVILFTTHDQHSFILNNRSHISYSLLLTSKHSSALKDLTYMFPTLGYTINRIGGLRYINPALTTSIRIHSARTTCITNRDDRETHNNG